MKPQITIITKMLILAVCFALFNTLYSQSVSLDLSFDNDGKVVTAVGNYDNYGYSIAIQSDGKILVVGYSNNGSNEDFTLIRYNTNGSLDSSFNSNGIVITDFGFDDYGRSISLQSDGKIVVAGYSNNGSNYDFALLRYNTNGSLDSSFDADGKVITSFGTSNDYGNSLTIQSDGKIVVAGESRNESYSDFALVRYNTNGSLDSSFDSDGKVTTIVNGSALNGAYSVVIQSDGKIVAAGYSGHKQNGTDFRFALVRYNINGSLDNSFDKDGKVTTDIGTFGDLAYSIVIQSDGKIVAAGYSGNGSNLDFALVRFNTNGSLDNNFGTDGKVTTAVGNSKDVAHSIVIQSDNKIIAAGQSNHSFALMRYNTDGSLDNIFDTDGKVFTDIGNGDDGAFSIAIQNDGKIVAAGFSNNGPVHYYPTHIAVVRYNNTNSVSINETAGYSKEMFVFPNPFSTYATLQTSNILKNPRLTFYNLYGQSVKQITSLTIKFGNTISFNRDNLPTGTYFIQLIDDNQIISTNKLVITD
ncbi:MAG: T9SS type A sorting domain-containing protein [Saprospiraceae bacterium]|uniref:T9SS type A sorting domain-containing protein n=1 Tax=Candidatus Defluviibacterium haderslevense TaxID=2981993 RepID=A0A9D7S7L3_9BACT|nr:T9SS type A sorting domain-containing protein [Candidatus Defluviibacterium haderslevense]